MSLWNRVYALSRQIPLNSRLTASSEPPRYRRVVIESSSYVVVESSEATVRRFLEAFLCAMQRGAAGCDAAQRSAKVISSFLFVSTVYLGDLLAQRSPNVGRSWRVSNHRG